MPLWPNPDEAIALSEIPLHAGLGQKDRRILDAMIENGFFVADRVWINQVVGNLPTWIDEITDPKQRAWIEATYSKRPDLIADVDGQLWAVELKPYASYVALGQAIMYAVLATIKTDPPRPVISWILTDLADPDLLTLLNLELLIRITELGRFLEPRPSFPT